MNQISGKLTLPKNEILTLVIGSLFVLLIPMIASLFSSEVNWQFNDFAVMAALCLITGSAFMILSKANPHKKWLFATILLGLFFYIWAELAVGIFTTLGN